MISSFEEHNFEETRFLIFIGRWPALRQSNYDNRETGRCR
jgi:hypothetical protein